MPITKTPSIINTTITSLSHDGRGIAHIDGKTTFIEGALPEEEITFTYRKRHKNYDEGMVTEILKSSPQRTVPKCEHFAICGGCSLQHVQNEAQLDLKQKVMLEQLFHFGNVKPLEILPPIRGPIYGYRHKARLGVKYVIKKNKVLVGFHEKNGRFIADITNCPILHDSIGTKITELQQLITQLSNYQHIPQIEVAVGDKETALIFRHLKEFTANDLQMLQDFGAQFNFKIYLQPKGRESIYCLTSSEEYLDYSNSAFCTLRFHPTDFTQINKEINCQMVAKVLEFLDPQPNETILDLFCGLGNFTIPLAKHCREIVGIEGDDAMVKRGYDNAEYNKVKNANFYKCDLAKEITELQKEKWLKLKFDKILLDPPRTGALEIVKLLPQLKVKKIVYVSCNPATLARDAKELAIQNYCLTKVGIIDMFPNTAHVETIAVFEKID